MQSSMVVPENKRPVMGAWKVRALGGLASISGLAVAASASTDLNATIGPILESVITLIPTIIELVVAIVPAIITMAVIGFIVAFFDQILKMMKL